MNESVKKFGLQFGLYITLINTLYIIVGYSTDLNILVNAWGGIFLFVASLTLLVLATILARKDMGGYIDFKDAFSTFMTSFVIYSLANILLSYVLFVVVDPEAAIQLKDITIQATADRLESFGVPEVDLDAAIEDLQNTDQYALPNLFKAFGFSFIFYAFIGLLVSAIVKKKKPEAL
ncbi:MAG: hypothetical protein ACI97P_001653 [Arcticibacterium sp.]|jgi:hypothetical protein